MMLSGKFFSMLPITKYKLLNGTETSFRRALISNKTVTCVKKGLWVGAKKTPKRGEGGGGGREGRG